MEEVHEVVEGEGKVVEGEDGRKVEGQGQTDVWDGLTVSGERLMLYGMAYESIPIHFHTALFLSLTDPM